MKAPADTPLLELRELSVDLGAWPALMDVSFDLSAGACLGIAGETGSGKSLTCRALTGLLPRPEARVTKGSAAFQDLDLLSLSATGWQQVRGRRIALVPQSSQFALNPVLKVRRQLQETIRVLDPSATPGARALELLELVHMPRAAQVLDLYAHELSGGMRQRVMIALALAGRPQLLVADEPTTALDVTVQRAILELLGELRAQTGMALIIVTHDLGVIRMIADQVAVMYAGTVVEGGAVGVVLDSPRHPYTQALLAAQPASVTRGSPLAAIPGGPPGLADRPSGCQFSARCPFVIDKCSREAPSLKLDPYNRVAACWRAEELSQ